MGGRGVDFDRGNRLPLSAMRVLGLDAGGTKTVCFLADERCTVLAEARGPGANLMAAGARRVETILRDVIGQVLRDRPGEVAALCIGMAGVDRPGEAALIRNLLQHIVTVSHIAIVNDALVALEAGAPGCRASSSSRALDRLRTGATIAGRPRDQAAGATLADEGSGYWLGRQALRAAMREADGRGPTTTLTRRLLEHYQVARAQDLAQKVYAGDLKPSAIAMLAPLVQSAGEDGDPVAEKIIDTGATELAAAALAVAKRLRLSAPVVVLAGGIFRAVPRMRAGVTAHLSEQLPGARAQAPTSNRRLARCASPCASRKERPSRRCVQDSQ
jgi:N-acetylglucosamine kinase-like BadF-type ATPase